jgi:prevent-host-death family protein
MTQVNLYEAKTQLSQLVERAAAGETIIIAKNGKPVAALVAPTMANPPRRVPEFGFLRDEWPPFTDEEWAESDRYVRELFEESVNKD